MRPKTGSWCKILLRNYRLSGAEMPYVARYTLGNGQKIETSSSETPEGSLELLLSYFNEIGMEVPANPENLEIEYVDIPYVFSNQRNWKGELIKIYGFTIETFKRTMVNGTYSGVFSTYLKMIDPKVSVEEKVRLYEVLTGERRGVRKRVASRGERKEKKEGSSSNSIDLLTSKEIVE